MYDFFGYLASGGLLLAAWDTLHGARWLLAPNLPPPLLLLGLLLGAYVLGHLVAHIASVLIESVLVIRVLGPAESLLMGRQSKSAWRLIFPGHFKPMPSDLVSRVRGLAESQDAPTSERALFLHCHAIVRQYPATLERLNAFLALYGFCRNLAMATIVAAGALVAARLGLLPGAVVPESWVQLLIALVALCYLLILRYLKFYRLYTLDVFIAFSAAKA